MKKSALIVLFFAFMLLGATGLTEYLFYRQDESVWVQNFENLLHKQETWADEVLKSFRDSVQIEQKDCEKDVVFLGFHEGKLFFWTDELMGDKELYQRLCRSGNFIKLGNTYYEIRHQRYDVRDYFALLQIKDAYPYNSKYVKDKFGSFLKISEENASQVNVLPAGAKGAHLIRDNNKVPLFSLVYDKDYIVPDFFFVSVLCVQYIVESGDVMEKAVIDFCRIYCVAGGYPWLYAALWGSLLCIPVANIHGACVGRTLGGFHRGFDIVDVLCLQCDIHYILQHQNQL